MQKPHESLKQGKLQKKNTLTHFHVSKNFDSQTKKHNKSFIAEDRPRNLSQLNDDLDNEDVIEFDKMGERDELRQTLKRSSQSNKYLHDKSSLQYSKTVIEDIETKPVVQKVL